MTDAHVVTSAAIQRALGGDAASLDWVVRRYTPLLLSQARYRLAGRLGAKVDAEDLVGDVWLAVLRNLDGINPLAGRTKTSWAGYLASALVRRIRDLLERHLSDRPLGREEDVPDEKLRFAANDVTGVVTRTLRLEANGQVTAAIDALSQKDREIVVLRGIEQNPYAVISSLLNESENTLTVRYRRALEKLRAGIPEDLLEELPVS